MDLLIAYVSYCNTLFWGGNWGMRKMSCFRMMSMSCFRMMSPGILGFFRGALGKAGTGGWRGRWQQWACLGSLLPQPLPLISAKAGPFWFLKIFGLCLRFDYHQKECHC